MQARHKRSYFPQHFRLVREENEMDRTIVEAVYGTYAGMTKNRIKRINSAAGGARVVELWDANQRSW